MDYGHPVVVMPRLVSPVQQRVDGLPFRTGGELVIMETARQVFCRGHVSMARVPADPTTERLLGGGGSGGTPADSDGIAERNRHS